MKLEFLKDDHKFSAICDGVLVFEILFIEISVVEREELLLELEKKFIGKKVRYSDESSFLVCAMFPNNIKNLGSRCYLRGTNYKFTFIYSDEIWISSNFIRSYDLKYHNGTMECLMFRLGKE